uniref:Uncharacterized protein n=1 Tax=Oryza meridionalis TaxID=40149 RepID=A0A0E0EZJ2_9ORYZ
MSKIDQNNLPVEASTEIQSNIRNFSLKSFALKGALSRAGAYLSMTDDKHFSLKAWEHLLGLLHRGRMNILPKS